MGNSTLIVITPVFLSVKMEINLSSFFIPSRIVGAFSGSFQVFVLLSHWEENNIGIKLSFLIILSLIVLLFKIASTVRLCEEVGKDIPRVPAKALKPVCCCPCSGYIEVSVL